MELRNARNVSNWPAFNIVLPKLSFMHLFPSIFLMNLFPYHSAHTQTHTLTRSHWLSGCFPEKNQVQFMWLWYLRWPLGDDLRQMWRQFVLSSNFECTPKSDRVANKNLVPTNPNKYEKLTKAYYGIQITCFQQSLWTVTILLNGFKWYQAANVALKHRV